MHRSAVARHAARCRDLWERLGIVTCQKQCPKAYCRVLIDNHQRATDVNLI